MSMDAYGDYKCWDNYWDNQQLYIYNYIVNNYVVSGDYNYSIVELDELLDSW